MHSYSYSLTLLSFSFNLLYNTFFFFFFISNNNTITIDIGNKNNIIRSLDRSSVITTRLTTMMRQYLVGPFE